jgi:uncharacterized protein DUF3606
VDALQVRIAARGELETDMPDDLSKKGVQDRSRINVHEPWEVRFWARELETTEEKLREAVKAVGPQVKAVRKQLAMREA